MNDIKVSENFKLSEFESPDTEEVKLDGELLYRLQKLRETLKVPLIINSGYRTKGHNAKVGGSPRSQHLEGRAVDISRHTFSMSDTKLVVLLVHLGFKGIGIGANFIHVDTRTKLNNTVGRKYDYWTY